MKRTIQRHCTSCSMCAKTQHQSTTDPEGALQNTPTTNGIHPNGLDRRIPAHLQQRKQVCTHSSMHADWIYFLHSDKIQESRGCYESINRQDMLCISTFKKTNFGQMCSREYGQSTEHHPSSHPSVMEEWKASTNS